MRRPSSPSSGGADDDYASGPDSVQEPALPDPGDLPMFAVGFITAFVVALIAIKTFLSLIKRISFVPFAIYRFIVAAVVYMVFL